MSQFTPQQAFELGLQQHQAGRLAEAEQIYRRVLERSPDHVDALHFLGLIALQMGRNEIAMELISRAVALNPRYAAAFCNLGNALRGLGKPDEAAAVFGRAIALDAGLSEAHYNLANLLRDAGKIDEAIAAYQKTIAIRPDHLQAQYNLANAFKDRGSLDEAIAGYRRVIALDPKLAEAHSNLGIVLGARGHLDEAIDAFRAAIAINANLPEAHNNLAIALGAKGQFEGVIGELQQAIALRPNYAEACYNLGIAMKETGQLDAAIAAYRRAIAINPDHANAQNNLGIVLKDTGQLDAAIAAYRQAIALKPGFAMARSNLIYAMHLHPGIGVNAIAGECRRWDLQYVDRAKIEAGDYCNDRSANRRLRIGYVSPDFREHVVGRNLMPLVARHNHEKFEITCYAQVARPDGMTGQFEKLADRWRNIAGWSDDDLVKKITDDQIDILVDLALHTSNNRLLVFARKPAPIQVAFAGYPGGTGLSTMDYRLSDPYLDPLGMDESIYTEKTIRLPDSFWCYDPLDDRDLAVSPLPALAESASRDSASPNSADARFITFGCLNNFGKINESVVAIWAEVMRRVENSRLLLMAPRGNHRQRMLDRLTEKGIDRERIEFVAQESHRIYLQLYQRIDVGLDCFPYNGHTTTLDALWMGVPVVTLVGSSAVSRAGWSHLSNLDLTELAAQTRAQFVEIAVELAGDLSRLAGLRRELRSRMEASPLMDRPGFARNIEMAYQHMWNIWLQKQP